MYIEKRAVANPAWWFSVNDLALIDPKANLSGRFDPQQRHKQKNGWEQMKAKDNDGNVRAVVCTVRPFDS